MKWIISSCLLGVPCRYDGKSKPNVAVHTLAQNLDVKRVCPEVMGGLSTPRIPSEYDGVVVRNAEGTGVDAAYREGAMRTVEDALREVKAGETVCCILKEKSPSCGTEYRYNGTFTRTLVEAEGVTTEALYNHGIVALSEVVVEEVIRSMQDMHVAVVLPEETKEQVGERADQVARCISECGIHGVRVTVVTSEDSIPSDASIIFRLTHTDNTYVEVPSIEAVRGSHQGKLHYLLACLVAEALQAEGLRVPVQLCDLDDEWGDARPATHSNTQDTSPTCTATINIADIPQDDVLAFLCNTVVALRGVLPTV